MENVKLANVRFRTPNHLAVHQIYFSTPAVTPFFKSACRQRIRQSIPCLTAASSHVTERRPSFQDNGISGCESSELDDNETILMKAVDLDGIIDEIAAVDEKNRELMKQISQFTQVLRRTMQKVSLTARISNNEADRVKRTLKLKDGSIATNAALDQLMEEGNAVRKALACWQAQNRHLVDEKVSDQLALQVPAENHSATEYLNTSSPIGGRDEVVSDVPTPVAEGLENAAVKGVQHDGTLGTTAVSLPATHNCVISHPGAISCTTTGFKKDDILKTAIISMETVVKCEGDGCLVTGVNGDDYIALGLQAMANTATELKKAHFQRSTYSDPHANQTHRRIMHILKHGSIVSCSPMDPPSSFGHVSYIAKLRCPETGEEIQAMVKPRVAGDAEGWHRAPIEWVAYELNLILGMDYVPPVFYRRGGVDLDWKHYEEAAFIYWVPKCVQLSCVPASNWGVSVAHLLSDTRVLDVLIHNSDRHHGHFFYGEHWTHGNMRPILIDHAAGFRKEAVVKMTHDNAFSTGAITCIAASTYLRLRFLDLEMVADRFKEFLTEEEICGLMSRRQEILNYFDDLVQSRGYHRTVIE